MKAELYLPEDLATLSWPDTADGDYARRYLTPFMEHGPQHYVRNAHNTRVLVAKAGETVLPVTVTDFHPENTYACSPYSHYISYGGFEEARRLKNPVARRMILLLLPLLAAYFRRNEFDRVVYVNNWLLSTNLYPRLSQGAIETLLEALPRWFPDRAIVFRSVDCFGNPSLFSTLQDNGYQMVLSRQVWYQHPEEVVTMRQVKEDARVTRKNGHLVSQQLPDAELQRAAQLYGQLYLDKYSRFNPQFTEAFLRLARDENLLTFRTLQCEGRANAVLGYLTRNGTMTPPIFGYDTRLPQKVGLYRHLSLLALQEGLANGVMVHASAGVGRFKKERGAVSCPEYNAVYTRHLPRQKQRPWQLIKKIGDLAQPVFQKYDF